MLVGHGEDEKSRRYRQKKVLGIAFEWLRSKVVIILCKNKQLTTLKKGHMTRKVVQ